MGDDVFAMQYNPAALSRLKKSQAAAQVTQSIADVQMGYLGIASPLSPSQAMGFSLQYLNGGSADIYDGNGNVSRTVNGESDLLVGLGYARSFGKASGRLHLGANAKLLRSVILNAMSASAYAADFGALYEFPLWHGLASAGAVASNLGPAIRYSGGLAGGLESDPLPSTTRLALGYSHEVFGVDAVTFGLQVDRVFYEDSLYKSFGVEYDYHHLCLFRVGYRANEQSSGLRMGAGLRFADFSLDYGLGLMETFNNIQQLSLVYRFTIPGIRYPSMSGGPSPLETMAKEVQMAFEDQRLFVASDELSRIETFFPRSSEARELRARIQRDIDGILIRGNVSRRYDYALGFQHYGHKRWKEAVDHLRISARKEPENKEIQKYLTIAGQRK